MKRRICFVDDDPKALKVFQDAMVGVNDVWDCSFLATANAALKAMATQPFDAVVTKMRLPGVSGAKLLQEVGRVHPKTLRYILGDVADRELIINCIGGTHQFIAGAGASNPQDLISTIQRGLALDAIFATDQLRALAPRLKRLPSLPSTYFEVLKQVESPNASALNVGEVVGRDPAVTARLLQMVNSAAFAAEQKVTNPVNAVSMLGLETVKSLVLCLQVFAQNDLAKQAGLSFDRIWNHSLAVAKIARDITQLETNDDKIANEAFTAGLLHDIGRIVLASNLPQEYAAVINAARQQKRQLHEEEATQLGVTHAQVGAYLLGVWGMPARLVESAALHHSPGQASSKEFSLLSAVHLANVFSHEREVDIDGWPQPTLDTEYLNALGVGHKADAWRKTAGLDKPAAKAAAAAARTPGAAPVTSSAAPAVSSAPAPAETETLAPHPTSAPAAAAVSSNKTKFYPLPPPANARTHVAPRASHWPRWAMASASAFVALIALVLWLARSGSSANIQAQARIEPANNAPARIETPPTPPQLSPKDAASRPPQISPFDAIKVQAIFYRPKNPAVLINGKTLELGEKINNLEVVMIGKTNVVLAYGNERKIFRIRDSAR